MFEQRNRWAGKDQALDLDEAFYGEDMDAERRERFDAARGIQGIDEEIALLRVTLREMLDKNEKPDIALLVRTMTLLVKAVSVRYKLTQKAEQDLAANLAGVIQTVGGYLAEENLDEG